MSNLLDTAKENFSKMPLWGWGAIVGGFVLIAFLGSRRSTMIPAPTYASGGMESNKVSESEVASRLNQVVQDLQGSFGEKFYQQSSDFMKVISERDQEYNALLQSQNQGWTERVGNLTSSFNEQNQSIFNQLNDLSNAFTPKNDIVTVPAATTGSLRTGTYSSQADAQKVANALTQSYGGQNTQIVNENGRFRVVSSFEDTQRAGAVLDRLQERNLTQIGKVS